MLKRALDARTVKAGVRERQRVGIGTAELDPGPRATLPRLLDQRRAEVHADDAAARSDAPGERPDIVAGAASDIQQPLSRGGFEQVVGRALLRGQRSRDSCEVAPEVQLVGVGVDVAKAPCRAVRPRAHRAHRPVMRRSIATGQRSFVIV